MTACADSEGRSVPRTPGCSKAAGRPRPVGSHLLPGGPHHPLAPRSPGSPGSEPSPGPARPGTSFLHRTHLTRHGCSTRGRGRPGPRVPEGRPGWEPGAGWGWVGGSPGRGWVPQRRFQLFRCLKLAPAERCGHVTERRQSAPACLRVPAPNARRPEERRPRPGGRVRRPPGLEGRREGRGDARAAASRRLRPGSPREPPWSTSFRGSARHSAGWRPTRPALVSGPALGAACPPIAGTCPAGAPPRPASRGTGVHLLTGQTLRSRRHGDRSGCPFHRLVEREHGMR